MKCSTSNRQVKCDSVKFQIKIPNRCWENSEEL